MSASYSLAGALGSTPGRLIGAERYRVPEGEGDSQNKKAELYYSSAFLFWIDVSASWILLNWPAPSLRAGPGRVPGPGII